MKKRTSLFLVLTEMFVLFANGYSMHIMEGFLPKTMGSSMVYRMCAVLGYRD